MSNFSSAWKGIAPVHFIVPIFESKYRYDEMDPNDALDIQRSDDFDRLGCLCGEWNRPAEGRVLSDLNVEDDLSGQSIYWACTLHKDFQKAGWNWKWIFRYEKTDCKLSVFAIFLHRIHIVWRKGHLYWISWNVQVQKYLVQLISLDEDSFLPFERPINGLKAAHNGCTLPIRMDRTKMRPENTKGK